MALLGQHCISRGLPWFQEVKSRANSGYTLRSALDIYRGREYLYKEPEALICRCFGVRENDVLDYNLNMI
jgi:hypothetical protein